MKSAASFVRFIPALLIAGVLLWSCAKLQDTLPTAPAPVGVHPAGWADSTKSTFHANYLRANGWHIDSCTACHGTDFKGGTSGKSCASAGCHLDPLIFHPAGWPDTTSADFHGLWLRANKFPIDSCANCHGRDFTGGTAQKSCEKSGCHVAADNGPQACYNCHGDRTKKTWYPPRATNGSIDESLLAVGQHRGHLEDTTLTTMNFRNCKSCHAVPDSFRSPGHVLGQRARITFVDTMSVHQTNRPNPDVRATTIGAPIVPAPQYDPATGTCSNVYCHGAFQNGNAANAPKWNAVAQDSCGTCHGTPGNPLPGGTHPKKSVCSTCHDGVVDDNNNIIDRSKHIDGKLNYLGSDYDVW